MALTLATQAQPFTNGAPEIDWEVDYVCYTPQGGSATTLSRVRIFQAGAGTVANSNRVSVRYYTSDGTLQEIAPTGTLENGACGGDDGFADGQAPPQYELVDFCDYLPNSQIGQTFFRIAVMQPGGVPFVVDTTAYLPNGSTYSPQGEQYDEPCYNLTSVSKSNLINVAQGGTLASTPSPIYVGWTATNTGLNNGTVTHDDGTNSQSVVVPPGLTVGCQSFELGSKYRIYMCRAPNISNSATTWNVAYTF